MKKVNKENNIDKEEKNKVSKSSKSNSKKNKPAVKKDNKVNNETSKDKNKKAIQSKTNQNRKKRNKKRGHKKSKKIIIIISVITILIVLALVAIFYKINEDKKLKLSQEKHQQEISSHYSEYVITNKETDLYKLNNDNYEKVGKIGNNQELMLSNQEITYNTEYFKISSFEEEYYVYYQDINTIEELTPVNRRYQKYIVFNKNIVTKDTTNFYDEDGNLIYTLPQSFDLPIIVNKKDIYGVEFNNRLLYVKQEDVTEVKNNSNAKETPSSKVRTLAYHRIYDPETEECDQVICHTESQFESHIKYLSENDYLTLTTEELSDFIDGYIQIPKKSTVITIDDGTMVTRGIAILEKYKLNASLFIVTIRFKESDYTSKFKSDYVELHSHSHNMHWAGECAGYGTQGGGILCLPEERVLEDLKTSSEILNGSTVFCYPFYDYNTRAINLLKEAGYTMAFAGLLNTNGYTYVGTNKMLIPRATILSYTTFAEFKAYVTY